MGGFAARKSFPLWIPCRTRVWQAAPHLLGTVQGTLFAVG